MSSEFGESTSELPKNSSFPGSDPNDDAGDLECNICSGLTQDPVVTPCGHLFCWPCLYTWLRSHRHSRECPICKVLIQDENLLTLYCRGKSQTGPRSEPVPDVENPRRFAFLAGLYGSFLSYFDFPVHGLPDAAVYGTTSGEAYNSYDFLGHGIGIRVHRFHEQQQQRQNSQGQQPGSIMHLLFVMICVLILSSLLF